MQRGDFVAIMGASGSGKSTMMNIIGCLDIPTSGRFLLDGVDVAKLDEDQLAMARNRKIGFIFQSFNLIPRTSAIDNVELPLAYAGVKAKERRERAMAALTVVGMKDRSHHLPNELSGGQQQRVAVARAIATNPALLLADEPTGNLDSKSTSEVLDVFDDMNAQGRTVVMITHEDDVAERAKRVIRLIDGEIVEEPPPARHPRAAQHGAHRRSRAAASKCRHRRSRRRGCAGRGGVQSVVRPVGAIQRQGARSLNTRQLFRLALRGVGSNRLRSALTILGILIGVASVVVLVAVGNGSAIAVKKQFDGLGTNSLTVQAGGFGPGGGRGGARTAAVTLTMKDVTALEDKQYADSIKYVVPIVSVQSVTATYGAASTSPDQFLGATADLAPAGSYEMAEGRFFTASDVESRALVAVIGKTMQTNLFGEGVNAVGEKVKFNKVEYEIIGVLKTKGSTGFRDEDNVVLAPWTAVRDTLNGGTTLSQLKIQATSSKTTDAAQTIVHRRHRHPEQPQSERHQQGLPGAQRVVAHRVQHLHQQDAHGAARCGCGHQLARRRHRDHEHHAGHGHRADPARSASARRSARPRA